MAERIIRKSVGSKGRKRPASEGGKIQSKVGGVQPRNLEKGSSTLVVDATLTAAQRKDVFATVDAAFEREKKKDAKLAITKVEESKGRIAFYVTANHLAVTLGKQLARSHKGGELTITWSKDDAPAYVLWTKK